MPNDSKPKDDGTGDRQGRPTDAAERPGSPAPGGMPDAGPMARTEASSTPGTTRSSAADVAGFVQQMRTLVPPTATGRGRLVFAMDATMSRQPTWDMALALQSEMFTAVKAVGTLDVQLVFFRGAGECRASKWVSDPDALARLMTTVSCAGGFTQIGKVLSHARKEAEGRRISALVHVGDCMEEDIDDLCGRAGELALLGVPVFMFQEGSDARAELTFKEIARLTRGSWCRFDHGSASQLRDLLSAVAVYAAGGRRALEQLGQSGTHAGARRLLIGMK